MLDQENRYFQNTKYFEYKVAGEKVAGAGFARMNCWGKRCALTLQLSNLRSGDAGERTVTFFGRDREVNVCPITLEEGRGRIEWKDLDCQDLLGSGFSVDTLEGLRIFLAPDRDLVCILKRPEDIQYREEAKQKEEVEQREEAQQKGNIRQRENIQQREEAAPDERKNAPETPEEAIPEGEEYAEAAPEEEYAEVAPEEEHAEAVPEEKEYVKAAPEEKEYAEAAPEEKEYVEEAPEEKEYMEAAMEETPEKTYVGAELKASMFERAYAEETMEEEVPTIQPYSFQGTIKPGKWEQLCALYPTITPFGDSRKYLSIGPGDFVILKDRSYRKVNNSFLLHGYFHYKHLILHQTMERGEARYFIGVPGNYFDKEKEVALLFGFESFECMQEPAKDGDFGYYMMRVEL